MRVVLNTVYPWFRQYFFFNIYIVPSLDYSLHRFNIIVGIDLTQLRFKQFDSSVRFEKYFTVAIVGDSSPGRLFYVSL